MERSIQGFDGFEQELDTYGVAAFTRVCLPAHFSPSILR